MSAAKAVTATFNTAPTFAIKYTKAGTGSGTVTFSPAGTQSSCTASCTNSYTSGTVVTLTATAPSGSTFAGWSGGACSGTSTCQLTMSAAKAVTATFNTAPTCTGIGCAVDDTYIWTMTTSNANPFYSQTIYKSGQSGTSAAQSGTTADYGSTCMNTTITGAGTLYYIWSVSSELNYDFLNLYVDNVLVDWISGNLVQYNIWNSGTYPIFYGGSHQISFCYKKDMSEADYLDSGFVDSFNFVPFGNTAVNKGGSLHAR